MNKSLNYSDEDFIEGLRSDNDAVLTLLYRRYYPMVQHLIGNNSGTEDEAKDIYQEAIIILYEKVKGGNFQLTSQLKTYIYAICRRLWLKKLAEKNRYKGRFDDSEPFMNVAADEEVPAEETEVNFTLMEESLVRLGEPCRTLLEDFYIRNLSMQDITEKFGYTNADNAKNQKYKCLVRLKKLFFESYKVSLPQL